MYLEKLTVQGIRNVVHAELDLSPGANFLFGLNGSGKTSLLEAIHILARGRSFRTRNLKTVINFGQKACTCFGLVNPGHSSLATSIPVGVMRDEKGSFIFKVNGRQVASASRLAEMLPIQVINSESFSLLEGSPKFRRSFVDWGVFHVEHSYRETFSRFQRCIKHRNSFLRHGKIDSIQLSVWDREFCGLSRQIDCLRRKYLNALDPYVNETVKGLGLTGGYEFRYMSGWDQSQSLESQLMNSLARDKKAGFTHTGPHRADLKIFFNGHPAAEILSRGQIKTLVIGLKIAQGKALKEIAGQQCIYLLDDLPSELDVNHRDVVSRQLSDMNVQVLVTGVERDDLESLSFSKSSLIPPAMFHVKHGEVKKM